VLARTPAWAGAAAFTRSFSFFDELRVVIIPETGMVRSLAGRKHAPRERLWRVQQSLWSTSRSTTKPEPDRFREKARRNRANQW
jgi:hypothetical protein